MKCLIVLVLLQGGYISQAQIVKYKAKKVAIYEWYNKVEDTIKYDDCDLLVVVDNNDGRIKIYTSDVQEFDIIRGDGKTTKEGSITNSWVTIDKEGKECRLYLTRFDNRDKHKYDALAVRYPNWTYTYQIKELD